MSTLKECKEKEKWNTYRRMAAKEVMAAFAAPAIEDNCFLDKLSEKDLAKISVSWANALIEELKICEGSK